MAPIIYDHDAILKDYLAGMTGKAIAAKYGCNPRLPIWLARKRGVSRSAEVAKSVRQYAELRRREVRDKSPQRAKLLKLHKRVAEYAKRHGIAATAAKYGYSRSAALDIAKRHGWIRPPLLYDQQAILRDYIDGMKLRVIAEKHGCDVAYPTQLAKRAGKLRQNRGKQKA